MTLQHVWSARYRVPGGGGGTTSFPSYAAALAWLSEHSKRLGCGDVAERFPARMDAASFAVDDPRGYSFAVDTWSRAS